ncbi:integrase arm-type DNA-binding domain-containing protein [uncultured Mailhella sp.]|uniref:tyrosine-type recombinase/integrase n=1 Tax=uncultured Mailhella sp. TaxID=1981031 RepID=UPI0025FE111E|nr:integrase arm-type DNA-binding domain-containing protein [uncultured Mailhella sp.]
MFDGEGLYLFVTRAGGKFWRMKYRKNDGKEDTLTFGSYPEVSLRKARELKAEARRKLALGIDPKEEKRRLEQEAESEERDKALTFEVVGKEWFEKRTVDKTALYRHQLSNRLNNQIFPEIGNIPIKKLKPVDILAALRKVEARGALEMAKRLARCIRQICSYAVSAGYIDLNPASELTGALASSVKSTPRAAITSPSEVGALLRALEQYQGHFAIKYALQIMPYVFVRSQELRNASWKEIDFEKALWIIPAERMKKRREHIVPLAHQVVTLFKNLQKFSGDGEYVFPSPQSKSQCISDVGLLNGLRRLGYGREEMCIHGFRAMASTLLNEQQYNPDVIEAQLAHVEKNNSRRPYNRAQYLDERRKMMQEWADYLDELREKS